MAVAPNQVVSIEYSVSDGTRVVDSNVGGQPLIFIVGQGQIIPGLETGMAHMNVGEKADILVKASDAYGEYNETAQQVLPQEQFAGIDLNVGMTLYGQGEDGHTVQVTVKAITEEGVVIDFNHPLAGKDLMFTVSLLMIRNASEEELASGIPEENRASSGSCCGTGSHGCGCH